MKPIVVATDFSELSYTATRYAIAIALETKAKIILVNVYQVPIPPAEMYVVQDTSATVYEASMARLKEMAEFEKGLYGTGKLEIECDARAGFTVNEILSAAKSHGAGLIVMGTHGASGLKKIIFGSNTANVIAKSEIPVLAVPHNAKYQRLKLFVFAADLHEIKNNNTFDVLMETALLFNARIEVLSVRKSEDKIPGPDEAFEAINIDKVFDKVEHNFHTVVSDDVVKAIDEFVKEHNPDLLVTVPQKHGYFDRLFNKSVTLDLVQSTSAPVLCLPDQE